MQISADDHPDEPKAAAFFRPRGSGLTCVVENRLPKPASGPRLRLGPSVPRFTCPQTIQDLIDGT